MQDWQNALWGDLQKALTQKQKQQLKQAAAAEAAAAAVSSGSSSSRTPYAPDAEQKAELATIADPEAGAEAEAETAEANVATVAEEEAT